jgi:2-oxoglutarate dehydrogenase E2 component (dihydrolipoamide succinyltransferase)
MPTREIKVPQMGESVVEATVGQWLKQVGDRVAVGDVLVELETDKVDVEVGAEAAGVLTEIKHESGEDVAVGDVLALIDTEAESETAESAPDEPETETAETKTDEKTDEKADEPPTDKEKVTPVARRLAEEEGVDLSQVEGTGSSGRITKQDVEGYLSQQKESEPAEPEEKSAPKKEAPAKETKPAQPAAPDGRADREERIRMSRRRRTIAQRLVEAQQTAAMLTTFNEVDMSAVIDMRKRRQEGFVERHGIKLGFTSFFVKAVIGGLKAFPRLNAEIDGDEMVIKHYYDIGIAVGAEEGLVVPVVREADRKSFAEIEQDVRDMAVKAREGNLSLEDLRGGTFTITNGGVFGSMLSTPILNPPQVGILGLHNIVERPVVINGEVAIRPIMYLALTYDHRIVDGREAVLFLVRVKELIEDPESLLLAG